MSAMTRRVALLGSLLVAAAALFGWFDAEVMPEASVAIRAPSNFALASPPPSTLANDLSILAQRQPWGASKQEPAQGQAASKAQDPVGAWRIGGILKLGVESFVILIIQPQPNTPHFLRYLSVGNTLPDGRTIEEITGDTVLLRQGDRQVVLHLYLPGSG
ncbi:MAG: hypothetical protein HYR63_23370 [Proteobacteria bacterium]|nr:hypothetical protein [Pseudomonadota bacterium]